MHTGMNDFWTGARIGYYDRAAKDTSFHRFLASEIAKCVAKDEKIIELGAGLGYVTEILWRDGYDIKGYDNCQAAVDSANRRSGTDLVGYADASDIKDGADVLLMLFFGAISCVDDLGRYMSIAKKTIYVISAHSGFPWSGRKDRSGEVGTVLDEAGASYVKKVLFHEFNQPLKSIGDAAEFFNISYGSTKIPCLEHSGDKEYPLLFRNRKKMYMYVIERREQG